ncbi:MAG: hypothetical protein P8J61_00585 [Gammaproteobacteria bacterium]|jgi:hypothetical protein|nr:hypothetical protein [Gammaproteobacteria bacterium]
MSFSVWVRESVAGFPVTISFHALGMAFLVGIHFALDLRVLGLAPKLPVHLITKFYPLMWVSFVVALISGLMLLLAYPAKGLTNFVFYLKMILIASAFIVGKILTKKVVQQDAEITTKYKILALLSIGLWVSIIVAGRFLAYTYTILLTTDFY